ncbi:hypothetical protein H6P81_008737 [Aristolochia fimbriata]|uniref:Uncharacterized protein n=1 Tax=Aristolochia fimbriata TaxID=158543 RepID=A0AAV7EM53_ARIFI|nr:hypothetical protein H6P81_008737 [Aristolochia fimbriata]
MKQKMVIGAQMIDAKGRSKAMKIAVSVQGVISVSIEGKEKDQMSITGEGVDVVKLTRLIRKKMGYAELVSVSVMEEKKEQKKEEKKTPRVISVSIEGKEKDQMSITGEGVDVVKLTRLIRKKMGYAELVSVSVMEEKKEQKKEEKKTPSSSQMVVLPTPWSYPVQEPQVIKYDDPACSIM